MIFCFIHAFLDRNIDGLATSKNLSEIDEYTNNYNSENFKSTLCAIQPDTSSTIIDTNNTKKYIEL